MCKQRTVNSDFEIYFTGVGVGRHRMEPLDQLRGTKNAGGSDFDDPRFTPEKSPKLSYSALPPYSLGLLYISALYQ